MSFRQSPTLVYPVYASLENASEELTATISTGPVFAESVPSGYGDWAGGPSTLAVVTGVTMTMAAGDVTVTAEVVLPTDEIQYAIAGWFGASYVYDDRDRDAYMGSGYVAQPSNAISVMVELSPMTLTVYLGRAISTNWGRPVEAEIEEVWTGRTSAGEIWTPVPRGPDEIWTSRRTR
jgi:hypothetical protein